MTAIDDWEDTAASFRASGTAVGVRALSWTELPRDVAVRMFGSDLDAPSDVATVQVPHDRARSFADCDGWILFGDTTLGATAWLQPTIVVAPQLAERYAPAFAAQHDIERRIDTFLSWRRARAVLGTTVADCGDLVSYAGVHPDRVNRLPPLHDDIPSTGDQAAAAMNNPAIVWHPPFPWPAPAETAAMAWREYLEVGGNLPLWIVGRDADAIASVPAVASILDKCCQIGGSWQTRTILPGRRLDRLLNRAGVLWNPSVADDSYRLIARALARGIPVVAGDAPHLRSRLLGNTAQIPALRTYAAHDVVAAARALLAASALTVVDSTAFPAVSPASSHPVSWRETLDVLRPHTHDG